MHIIYVKHIMLAGKHVIRHEPIQLRVYIHTGVHHNYVCKYLYRGLCMQIMYMFMQIYTLDMAVFK